MRNANILGLCNMGGIMRRKQLTFKVDDFSTDNNFSIKGYIDANDTCELLHELLVEFGKIYEPNLSSEDFIRNVAGYSGKRFGATDVNVRGNKNG